jgi:arginyl-tRNA synthetase
MMIKDSLRALVHAALQHAQSDGSLPPFELPSIDLQRPKQPEHGDYSTNIAMVAAAAARKSDPSKANPRQIAQAIVDHLPASNLIGSAELAGPGFINFRLSDSFLQEQVIAILQAGESVGNIDRGKGQRWQVEYISANPTGPVHYGGARNGVLGDTLANVLEAAGYSVQREFYINDGGNQFNHFAATLYARYMQQFGKDEPVPEEGYAGEYMIDYAKRVIERVGDRYVSMPKQEAIAELKALGREIVLSDLEEETRSIGIEYDRWFSEQSLYDDGLVEQALEYLDQRGELVRRDGAVWFQASKYPKNEKDEVVIRRNGLPTYFASDIAYHYDKFIRRGFDHVINVWGVDHQGHVPRMYAMMQAFGLDPSRLTILLHDLVKLIRNGQEVKLSKRAGNIITIRDVVDEVGADAVRFNLLTRSPESTIEFDLDLAVAQSNENPVYYVQYSHARICSIVARANEEGIATDSLPQDAATVARLTHPAELALIRKLLELEEQIELAVDKLSPHNLTYYAIELARTFNAFYRDCRVVDPEQPELSQARLLLCQASRVVLAKVFKLIGVRAPESM